MKNQPAPSVLIRQPVFSSTKSYYNFPCAHRQHKHDGNCALIHGYSRSFHFLFGCYQRDKNGFVVDYGKLKEVKFYLEKTFDHTLLLNEDDPFIETFRDLAKQGVCNLVEMPAGVGMEATAEMVFQVVDKIVQDNTEGRAFLIQAEACENDKNSSIFRPQRCPNTNKVLDY
jgi:6-pyruvoyltetrahydropterin/6-carboxytetrahydropterin synthase